MMRTLLWVLAGVVLGGIIHILVILALPALASDGLWSRMTAIGAASRTVVLAGVTADQPNPLRLDPEMTYAVCEIDLRKGPGILRGTLPASFWSVAVYAPSGAIIYSTTNRDAVGNTLEVGVFNTAQTRLLAEQKLDIAEGLLIVESSSDDILAVVRLAPTHQAMRSRYEEALSGLVCGNIAS